MSFIDTLKKQLRNDPEARPEVKEKTVRSGTVEPLSDEDRARLIADLRSDLPELDRKVEKNLDRLRDLSRS